MTTDAPECKVAVVLKNKYGLHARPSTLIAQTAKKFESQVFLGKDGAEVDAKSIFGMLTLAAECGATLTVRARGKDASEAVAKLADVITSFQAED
jgi:phosphocarrier protein HPr